ncbi:MAG: cytochrome P450 [Pseudonocardiales bacterium]|nr:cytochrome P450 [Pseudonocardiales bacterium]MBV9651844.1 cytochrome P450 [Pseudonocardiales bacterium]
MIPTVDPYPTYRRLREQHPVYWDGDLDTFVVTSYAEANTVLRGPGWSSDPSRNPALAARIERGEFGNQALRTTLLGMDPPEHTRLRRLLAPAFTARAIDALQPRITAVVKAALADLATANEVDVITDIGYPIPLAVMCELLDVDIEGAQLLRTETPKLVGILQFNPDADAVIAAEEATASLALHLLPILGDRRHRPGADLASQLLCLEDNGDTLGLDEVLATCILLLTAGHETTANVIGNGVLLLMEHPDQLELLQRDPALIKPTIEEILRFECPAKIVGRTNLVERQLGEQTIRPGERVLVLLGAANRDPAQFPDPERFDITRTPAPHLAFGAGPHFCLGAALSRAEAQETLRQLLPLLTGWRLASEAPAWRVSDTFRALEKLHLVSPAAHA